MIYPGIPWRFFSALDENLAEGPEAVVGTHPRILLKLELSGFD
jgi:hypothetical protein